MSTKESSEATASGNSSSNTTARIRTLAIFFLGFGAYALIGGGLHMGEYLVENLTTYFVSGGVIFVIGLLLLTVAR